MRKPMIAMLICAVAAAAWQARPSRHDDPPPASAAGKLSASRTASWRGSPWRARLGGGGAGPLMPAQDERITAFLADDQTAIDDGLRDQLIELARTQQLGFGPRAPGDEETTEQRAARRAHRDDFRHQVRDALAAMPDQTRAAMRRHRVDVVRLGRALATL